MITNLDELIEIHQSRKSLYTFFSKIYLMMPNEKLYEHISGFLPVLKVIAENLPGDENIAAVAELENFFNTRDKLSAKELADFDLEALRKYTTLFCLGNSVPVYESVYTSPQKLVMQEARDEMLALFRKYSLAQSKEIKEFEDHISLELMFMAKLIELSVAAMQNDDEAKHRSLLKEQLSMYENHFDKWIKEFVDKIMTFQLADVEIIYRTCSKLMLNFMYEDKQIIKEFHNN